MDPGIASTKCYITEGSNEKKNIYKTRHLKNRLDFGLLLTFKVTKIVKTLAQDDIPARCSNAFSDQYGITLR